MRRPLRRLERSLPAPVRDFALRLRRSPRLRRSLRPVRWGSLRRLDPISQGWGSGRGTPVDRHYIDRFFAENAELIRGRVLEVGDLRYTSQFGREVRHVEIVDIDPRNDEATIVADLAEPNSLPRAAFDCAVVPQTLVYVRDPIDAAANLWQSLAPSGAVLITVPAIARVDLDTVGQDRWHLTPAGLEEVIRRGCPGGAYAVRGYGNPLVAIAFLHGLAHEELRPKELEADHPLYPIVVTATVRKPAL